MKTQVGTLARVNHPIPPDLNPNRRRPKQPEDHELVAKSPEEDRDEQPGNDQNTDDNRYGGFSLHE